MIRRSSREAVREEARAWVIRLQDAHGAAEREEFKKWLAKDPAHQSAYDQVHANYASSGVLRASDVGRKRDLGSAFAPRHQISGRGLALASIAGVALIGAYVLERSSSGMHNVALESVMLSSGVNGRNVRLADGSNVGLGARSEVRIDLRRTERVAEVQKGRVRVRVAREKRPFRIVAGASSVVVTEGSFDAALVGGEGSVTRLETKAVGSRQTLPGGSNATAQSAAPSRQVVEFDAETLATAVDRINQLRAGPKLELAPDLAGLRVTGVFQQGTSEDIARSLASAFGLKLTSPSPEILLLSRRK